MIGLTLFSSLLPPVQGQNGLKRDLGISVVEIQHFSRIHHDDEDDLFSLQKRHIDFKPEVVANQLKMDGWTDDG